MELPPLDIYCGGVINPLERVPAAVQAVARDAAAVVAVHRLTQKNNRVGCEGSALK